MFSHKASRVSLASILLVSVAACYSAPTEEENAFERAVKSVELAPATAEARQEIKLQDPVSQATFWGIEYEKSPADIEAATEFAKALRAIGSEQRAAEIASQTLSLDPDNYELLSLLGKSLLSSGNVDGAVDILRRAIAKDAEDLTVLGALGVAYDQTGRHREAQNTYRQVLLADPNNAAALSNYGLSLALTGDPETAESVLRRAVSQPEAGPRERQNLAMVLSLQGKFDEAKTISAADLPDDQVDGNINYFRAMLTTTSRRYNALRGTTQ